MWFNFKYSKSFVMVSMVFIVFVISFFSTNRFYNTPANISLVFATPEPSPSDVQASEQEALFKEGQLPQISWVSKVYGYMTYGRLIMQNLDFESDYKFFIAEPYDVMEDDVYRRSPTTMNLVIGDVVLVSGEMSASCYWENGFADTDIKSDYKGCIPWIEINKIKPYVEN